MRKEKYHIKKCLDCGKSIKKSSFRCHSCNNKWFWNKRKIPYPNCMRCGKVLRDRRSLKCKSCSHKGRIVSKETRKKSREISLQQFKNGMPKSTKKKISLSMMGEKNHFYGKKHPIQTRRLIGEYKKDKSYEEMYGEEKARKLIEGRGGVNSIFWEGGISFEPYNAEFNRNFKREIKKRDKNICLKCGISETDSLNIFKEGLHIHHINYNKKLTISKNCITLCRHCHAQTNFNRHHWTNFFQSLLSERYGYKYSENREIILEIDKND